MFLQPIAEAIVAHDDLRFLEELWREWSPGFDPTDEIGHVKDALREPANLTAALEHLPVDVRRSRCSRPSTPPQLAAVFGPTPSRPSTCTARDDGCVSVDVVEPTRAVLPAGLASRARSPTPGTSCSTSSPTASNDLVLDFLAV